MDKKFAVIITYDLDRSTPIFLFDAIEDAESFLKSEFKKELEHDQEEMGWPVTGYLAESKDYAEIVTSYPSVDCTTTFRIGEIYN